MIKREDVIVDPTDPRVEGLIGKKVYMGNSYAQLSDRAYSTLKSIVKNSNCFMSGAGYGYTMIAPIPEPTCRPFKSAEEFAPFRDKWVVDRGTGIISHITGYNGSGIFVNGRTYYHWSAGLSILRFDDYTPFGVKENN